MFRAVGMAGVALDMRWVSEVAPETWTAILSLTSVGFLGLGALGWVLAGNDREDKKTAVTLLWLGFIVAIILVVGAVGFGSWPLPLLKDYP